MEQDKEGPCAELFADSTQSSAVPVDAVWAKKHPHESKRGESSTEWEALEKAHKQEALNAIEKSTKRSKDLWDYINDNHDALFNNKNQVRK